MTSMTVIEMIEQLRKFPDTAIINCESCRVGKLGTIQYDYFRIVSVEGNDGEDPRASTHVSIWVKPH